MESRIVINGISQFPQIYAEVEAAIGMKIVPGGKIEGRDVTKKLLVNKMPVRRALFDLLSEALENGEPQNVIEELKAILAEVNGNETLDEAGFVPAQELEANLELPIELVDYYLNQLKKELPNGVIVDANGKKFFLKSCYPVLVEMIVHSFPPHGWLLETELLDRLDLSYQSWQAVRKQVERKLGGGFRQYRSTEVEDGYKEVLHVAWEVAEMVCKAMGVSFEDLFWEFKKM